MTEPYKIIEVKESVFADNDREAARLRVQLKQDRTFLLNLMSSPGSGKTTTLLRTLEALKDELRIGVMEADIDSDVDAKTIADAGVKTIQLHTGGMCHLDASMTEQGLKEIGTKDLDLVVLENVGNLVCPAEFDTGRRGFFSSGRDEARAAAAITAEHVVREKLGAEEPEEPKFAKVAEDGTLPHFLPERRGRLLLALSNLGSPEDVMIDTRLFGHVIIDGEKCTSCQMCATFCPTEAIRKFGDAATAAETGKPFGIDHYTGRCVQCHCCEDICPTGALTLSTDVFATDVTKRGRSERIPMKPRKRKVNDPKSIVNAMSDLLGVPNVYER